MAKLTKEEMRLKRLDILEKTCLDLLHIVNKLMPTVEKIMDGMITQNKSIGGLNNTLAIQTDTLERTLALLTDAMERITELEAELKLPSKPKHKDETRISYIS